MPCTLEKFNNNVKNYLAENEVKKLVRDGSVLAAMKELKKVYDNESGTHATEKRYKKFLLEGVAFSVSWKSLKRYLRDNFTIDKDKDDKLCYDGKEVLSLEDYYLRASQMLGEIDGTLTSGNIKTLKEKMNEKYWVNSCVLIEGLFPSKFSSKQQPATSTALLKNHTRQAYLPATAPIIVQIIDTINTINNNTTTNNNNNSTHITNNHTNNTNTTDELVGMALPSRRNSI